jgi:hypothetical protein
MNGKKVNPFGPFNGNNKGRKRHDAIQKGKLRSKCHFADIWWNARSSTDRPTFVDALVVAVDLNGTCYCIVSWDPENQIGYDEIIEKGSTRIRMKEKVPEDLLFEVAEEMKKGEMTIQEIKDEYLNRLDEQGLEKVPDVSKMDISELAEKP